MKVQTITFKGITRFANEVHIDLRHVPPGLVAITGLNGEGKTTVLEAMLAAYYRQLPSRGDVLPYATGKDSFIDVQAEFEGRGTYRARLGLDGLKRTSDAVLELTDLDGRRSVLNDGKVSTFDPIVRRELPPLGLVLASSFAAQNRTGTFVKLDKKGRKDLFAALLGLDHYEQMAQTSRTSATLIERRRAELAPLIAHLLESTSDDAIQALQREGLTLADHLSVARSTKTDCATRERECWQAKEDAAAEVERLSSAHKQLLFLRDNQSRTETELDRTIDLQVRLKADANVKGARISERREARIGAATRGKASLPSDAVRDDALRARLEAIAEDIDAKIADKGERIANNRKLVDRGQTIRTAAAKLTDARARHDAAQTTVDGVRAFIREAETSLNRARVSRASIANAQAEKETVLAAGELLHRVPCGGAAPYDGCELLAVTKRALATLPEIEGRIARLETLDAEIATGEARLNDLRKDLAATQRRQTEAALEISDVSNDASWIEKLDIAEKRIEELQADIDQFVLDREKATTAAREEHAAARKVDADRLRGYIEEIEAANREADADHAANAEQLRVALAEQDTVEASLRAELATLQAQIAELVQVANVEAAQQTLEQAKRDYDDARVALSAATDRYGRLATDQEHFDRRRAEFDARLAERLRLEAAAQQLDTDLIEWQNLAKVLGRDGLPVLEIDASGPGVSVLANDLLTASFGGRFQVELVTQEPKADGKGFKEVFELKVYDNERGGAARDIQDLSGGEQVIVDEALKSAIALFVNQRNVLPIRTAWRDETTGALDPDNARRYIAMLRRVHQRGGLHHLFFISQSPEVSALADAQLVVANGTVTLAYPPFSAVEAA